MTNKIHDKEKAKKPELTYNYTFNVSSSLPSQTLSPHTFQTPQKDLTKHLNLSSEQRSAYTFLDKTKYSTIPVANLKDEDYDSGAPIVRTHLSEGVLGECHKTSTTTIYIDHKCQGSTYTAVLKHESRHALGSSDEGVCDAYSGAQTGNPIRFLGDPRTARIL